MPIRPKNSEGAYIKIPSELKAEVHALAYKDGIDDADEYRNLIALGVYVRKFTPYFYKSKSAGQLITTLTENK